MAGVEERFWAKVEKTDTCWFWTGGRTASGYGAHRVDGRQVGAHRLAYTFSVGPIPAGMQIDHLCRMKHCVNPAHLEAVTPRENTHRAQQQDGVGIGKTHCPSGHLYDAENTRRKPDGRRVCKTCAREYAARKRGPRQPPKTHCPQGHEYSPENTYLRGNKRRCNTCHRERERRRRQREAIAA